MTEKPKRLTIRELWDLYLKAIAEIEQLRMEVELLKARWTERPPPTAPQQSTHSDR